MRVLFFAFLLALVYSVSAAPAEDDDYDPNFGEDDPNIQKDFDYDGGDDVEEQSVGSPDIESESKTFIVRNNDRVLLPCKVRNAGGSVIMWYKDSTQLLFQESIRIGNVLDNIQVSKDRSLIISNITENDYGEYRCEVVAFNTGNPSVIYKVVNPAPHNVTVTVENDIAELEAGGKLVLKCTAEGTPKPNITWHKDSTPLGVHGETLIIENLKHSDAGTYRCLADNNIGFPAHAFQTIRINHEPRVEIQRILGNQSNIISAEFKCIVHAEPTASVVWQKDQKNVVASRNIEQDNIGYTHILKINEIKPEDFGDYTCYAANKLGSTTKTIPLHGKPTVMKFKKPGKNTKGTELTWEVDSLKPILEHVVEYRKENTDQWKTLYPEITGPEGLTYTIKYAIPELEPGKYEARARSKNTYGWSKWSEKIIFEGVSKKHGHHKPHHKKTTEATTQAYVTVVDPQPTDGVKTGGVKSKSSGSTVIPTFALLCITILLLRY